MPAHPLPTGAIEIDAAAVRLAGDCRVPAGASGLVLFAHGSGSGRLSPRNRQVAEALNAAGLGTLRVGAPGGLSSEAIGRPLSGCRGRYRTPWKDFHGIVPSPLHGLAIAIHHSGLFDLRAGFAGFRRHVDGPGAADEGAWKQSA